MRASALEFYGGLTVDTQNNVYVSVAILGMDPFMLNNQTVTPDLFGNVLVMRLAATSGAIEWLQVWGGNGQDRPHGLTVLDNDLFVTGETSSTQADFGPFPLSGAIGDAFIVRASLQSGQVEDLKHLTGNLEVRGIAARGTRVALLGDFVGSTAFDAGCSINSSGLGRDGFVADFRASDLDCQWTQDFGDSTDDMGIFAGGIAAFPEGGWVMTGGFQGNVLFAASGSALSSRGNNDVYAVRYGPDGDHAWSFRYGDENNDLGTAVSVTPEGEVLLTGTFASSITFGTIVLEGTNDVFVTRLTSAATPTHEWAIGLGGDNTDRSEGLATNAGGYGYVVAYFQGMTNVNGIPLTAAGFDAWVAALVR